MGFWNRQRLVPMMALHAILNTAIPVVLFTGLSVLLAKPEMRSFVLMNIAPWSALASMLIAWRWWQKGQRGDLPQPPSIVRDVLPDVLAWTVALAPVSLIVASMATGQVQSAAALDGALAGFFCALMSGIAINRQTSAAMKRGEYSA